jgi:fatty-acyl-CoA synthase
VDPATNEEVPAGVQGEVVCRGYNVMKGYYNLPEATAQAVDKDGWLHSGDLGTMDVQRYFKITGRIKDMIIRGGENISPREIEEYLLRMEGIRDVQVAGVASAKYGEEVGAFVIKKQGATITEDDVRDFCRGKIANFKIPRYVFFVESYPMTASGKIQKYKLRQMSLTLLKERGVEPA